MESAQCVTCRKPKGSLQCELCGDPTCKKCVQILNEDAFSFREEIADDLKYTRYCSACFDERVAPELDQYQALMDKAKNVFVFFKTRKRTVPVIKKSSELLKVTDQVDRDELILRLAFMAAAREFNAIMEVDLTSEKIRNEAYQTSRWHGSGVPAMVDEAKLDKQDLQEQMYR